VSEPSLALAERASEVYEEVEGEYGERNLSVVYQWLQEKKWIKLR
jgi:hypothetical protein